MRERAAQELSPKMGRMGVEDPSRAFGDAPQAAADSPAIHAVDLSKRFGSTVALAGLSMTVPRGGIFGFLGPNGAGKTTSVKLLLGLLKPTSGEAWALGQRTGALGTRRRPGHPPEPVRDPSRAR